MLCEKCKAEMAAVRTTGVQGWLCPICGWEILTTYIDEIYLDQTEYSIWIKHVTNINKDIIRIISKIAGVNYIEIRNMLEKDSVCILKAKAIEIKKAVNDLESADVPYEIIPKFKYR